MRREFALSSRMRLVPAGRSTRLRSSRKSASPTCSEASVAGALPNGRATAPAQLARCRQRAGLFEALADLFGAEGADAVEAEAEDHRFFLADAQVKGRPLHRDCAAVPGVTNGYRGVHQRVGDAVGPRLEIKK